MWLNTTYCFKFILGEKNNIVSFLPEYFFCLEAIAEQMNKQFKSMPCSSPKSKAGHDRWLFHIRFLCSEKGSRKWFPPEFRSTSHTFTYPSIHLFIHPSFKSVLSKVSPASRPLEKAQLSVGSCKEGI